MLYVLETDTPAVNLLYQPSATMSIYKYSFFPRTLRERNLLLTQVTNATTLEEFRVGLGLVLPIAQSWTADDYFMF